MLQSAQLIGRSTDDDSLYNYSTNLLQLYIEQELIFLPNSMRKTDMFITLVQKLLDDIIIRNEFSANEHPHTLAGLQSSLTHEFNQFWKDNMRKQLQSIYKDVQNMQGIPPREEVERELQVTITVSGIRQKSFLSMTNRVMSPTRSRSLLSMFLNPLSISTSILHPLMLLR
jgi:hypothetical protein